MIATDSHAVTDCRNGDPPNHMPVFVPMRLLIVDDHPMTCTGLKSLLQTCYPSAHIQTQHTIDEWVEHLSDWDYIFLDMHLPGVRFADFLTRIAPHLSRVILISANPEPDLVTQARAQGARGLLLKNANVEHILDGFRRIQAGEVVFSDVQHNISSQATSPKLTERQQEVLHTMLGGLSNKQIARELGITEHTVKDHVAAILTAYGVRNRMALILRSQQGGLE